MNPVNRDGWPPSQAPPNANTSQSNVDRESQSARPMGGFGAHNPSQASPQQSSGPSTGPLLPPPTGSFFSSNPPSGHNLTGLAGLASSAGQNAPSSASGRSQHDPSSVHQPPPPSSNFTLPGVNQTLHGSHSLQSRPGIEQDRDREMRDVREPGTLESIVARQEAEQRERDAREQQPPALENHTGPVHLHQPVAVAPSVRAIHGPNGLLGNPGAATTNTSNIQFASLGSFPQSDTSARIQQPPQQPAPSAQQNLLMPFANAGSQQGTGGIGPASQQPILNDALSYLDQVKVQFAEHPDVYNRFLDIMKDFKSGAIDTPGVIERVSQLFAGNPALIQGFNTFLPPGYKIECGAGDDPNTIRVTTPMGTTVSTMPPARPLSAPRQSGLNGSVQASDRAFFTDGLPWPGQRTQGDAFGSDGRQVGQQTGFGSQIGSTSHRVSPEAHRDQAMGGMSHQTDQRGVSQLHNAASIGASMQMGGRQDVFSSPGDGAGLAQSLNGGIAMQASASNSGIEKRGPVEFNHAISYVNKIKNRFQSQPDIYKQFLEILQTYQRESKPIQEVYAQVTRLFETAPDLLEDFKQFLPESAAQAKAAASRTAGEEVFPLSNTRHEPGYMGAAAASKHLQQTPRNDQPRLPPIGNFAPTPSATRENKRKRADRQTATTMTPTMHGEEAGMSARGGSSNAMGSKVRD